MERRCMIQPTGWFLGPYWHVLTWLAFCTKVGSATSGHSRATTYSMRYALSPSSASTTPPTLSDFSDKGFSSRLPFYYVDMELCDLNLDCYIRGIWPLNIPNRNPYFNVENGGLTHVWSIFLVDWHLFTASTKSTETSNLVTVFSKFDT